MSVRETNIRQVRILLKERGELKKVGKRSKFRIGPEYKGYSTKNLWHHKSLSIVNDVSIR